MEKQRKRRGAFSLYLHWKFIDFCGDSSRTFLLSFSRCFVCWRRLDTRWSNKEESWALSLEKKHRSAEHSRKSVKNMLKRFIFKHNFNGKTERKPSANDPHRIDSKQSFVTGAMNSSFACFGSVCFHFSPFRPAKFISFPLYFISSHIFHVFHHSIALF